MSEKCDKAEKSALITVPAGSDWKTTIASAFGGTFAKGGPAWILVLLMVVAGIWGGKLIIDRGLKGMDNMVTSMQGLQESNRVQAEVSRRVLVLVKKLSDSKEDEDESAKEEAAKKRRPRR